MVISAVYLESVCGSDEWTAAFIDDQADAINFLVVRTREGPLSWVMGRAGRGTIGAPRREAWPTIPWRRASSRPRMRRLPKENPGCWTRRTAFAQVRHGSNIQLLPFSLVSSQHGGAGSSPQMIMRGGSGRRGGEPLRLGGERLDLRRQGLVAAGQGARRQHGRSGGAGQRAGLQPGQLRNARTAPSILTLALQKGVISPLT